MNSKSFYEIAQLFAQSDAKVLSLDCFDTLFWRKVAQPKDIFSRIGEGISLKARERAEGMARLRKRRLSDVHEVTIEEIYAELEKGFSPEQQRALIDKEIALEIEHGFLFAPAVELLREAKRRGIRTIIVSDIYYSSEQLTHILHSTSPELATLIDSVYCSADFGYGKYSLLWNQIIACEKVEAQSIFHVGDNHYSDYVRATQAGINAVHFLQNEGSVCKALEHRMAIAGATLPASRITQPIPSLYHGCYSRGLRGDISGETFIGWMTLGPTMYTFARFIKQQQEALPRAKVAFLMRDGYMPRRAYQTLYPDAQTSELHISRLTTIRASFHDRKSIEDYLLVTFKHLGERNGTITQSAVELMGKHMMLSSVQLEALLDEIARRGGTVGCLYDTLLDSNFMQIILDNSARFRERLLQHIRKETGVEAGETLLLVDIGYDGTTQNRLSPLLEKALGITVRGCYLIASFVAGWQANRSGVINPNTVDARLIETLKQFISSFEMLCSSHTGSSHDYTEGGEVIVVEHDEAPWLSSIRAAQDAAIEFIREADTLNLPLNQAMRDSVAIDLIRYAYFPTMEEIRLQERYTFDINLGTGVSVAGANIEDAGRFMRKSGVARLMQGEKGNMRMNYASEMRYYGPEYATSALAALRYDITWNVASSIYRQQTLDVVFIKGASSAEQKVSAFHTFDGFYSAYIPVAMPEIALMAGKTLRDMEILSIALVPPNHIGQGSENANAYPLQLNKDYFIEGGTVVNNMITNLTDDGFLYFNLQNMPENLVLKLVYRPLQEKARTVNE